MLSFALGIMAFGHFSPEKPESNHSRQNAKKTVVDLTCDYFLGQKDIFFKKK